MEITGKICQVLQEQRFNGKNGEVVKNAFVIEWQDNGYAQKLCLEVLGTDKWDKMKQNITVGKDVLCKFSVTSREYQGRWFTSCQCWYCASTDSNSGGNAPQTQQAPAQQAQAPQQQDDDIPF